MSEKKYTIILEDGGKVEMTVSQLSQETGVAESTLKRRLDRKGMRRMEGLRLSPEEAQRRARRTFAMQSTAHFNENKKKREAVASRPVYREWKPR